MVLIYILGNDNYHSLKYILIPCKSGMSTDSYLFLDNGSGSISLANGININDRFKNIDTFNTINIKKSNRKQLNLNEFYYNLGERRRRFEILENELFIKKNLYYIHKHYDDYFLTTNSSINDTQKDSNINVSLFYQDIFRNLYQDGFNLSNRNVFEHNNVNIDILNKEAVYNNNLFLNNYYKNIAAGNNIFINSNLKTIKDFEDSLLLDIDLKSIYFNNEYLALDNIKKDISIYKYLNIKLKEKQINVTESSRTLEENDKDMYIYENIHLNKDIERILLESFDNFIFNDSYKIEHCKNKFLTDSWNKKLCFENDNNMSANTRPKELHVDNNWNFVDIIKYNDFDDPVLDKGNIDELILPHKDYRYKDFLKLLFVDGKINLKYVKEYNNKTGEYTIKIPIENPINIYADIARDYVDLDTNILYNVIDSIRTIWQNNVFRYVSMSAQDSLKDILIKLDEHLATIYLKQEEIYQYRRCMQLFRWYSEMAVLNNCEYILKFDTTKVEVDYYNKVFNGLENNITLENMQINDEYILAPIDETKSCAIHFRNNSEMKEPALKLHFKLYNINTTSKIEIIDYDNRIENADETVYECGVHDLNFKLKNRITVRYIPTEKNQSMNIADINIDGITTRGFTIQYKGKFGEVNSVMQDLLQQLYITEEISEELKGKLKDVTPTSIAIQRIIDYFEIHHKDKLKGKRLITKK